MAMLLLMMPGTGHAAVQEIDQVRLHPAIPLLDEAGGHVLDSGNPYSSKTTCGTAGCHDYDSITHAFHLEQGRDETRDDYGALRGLPQLVGPGYYGGINCMGSSNPDGLAKKVNANAYEFGDLGSPDFIMRCVTCHSGGGWMEKDRNGNRYDEVDITTVPMLDGDYYSRATNAGDVPIDNHDHSGHDMGGIAAWDWKKSGVVENDCLMCHVSLGSLMNFDPKLNVTDATAPLNQFRNLRNTVLAKDAQFRSLNTALLEFINLRHVDGVQEDTSLVTFDRTTDIPADVHLHTSNIPPYILNKDEAGQPRLIWNAAAFDTNRKVAIPMLSFPENDNCMNCHRTSNSRRGFYGLGESAAPTYDEEDGTLLLDYQDDVHKGKTWIEANGEERSIENCNACHTRNYYRRAYENVNLDAAHDMLKGNSDMDVANHLDYAEGIKTCKYCHDDAENPSIPSGQESMLAAHLERWKLSGDMAGYPQSELTKISQTHLDVISCEACHINGKKARGRPLTPLYRYRTAENGDLQIVPYTPKLRYHWKDKTSGHIMDKTERNSVFEKRTDEAGESYGAIIDVDTKVVLGSVGINSGMHGESFADPADYENFKALKQAYDKALIARGFKNPDMVMVWTESNQYVMSHNTRPAVSSVQCEECHSRKQDGSFSSLISADGLFGESNIKTITQLPDPRLVDEGLVIFDYPYMKADENGKVTENVSDILYASKLDPSLSFFKAAVAPVATGVVRRMSATQALAEAGISADAVDLFPTGEVYFFSPNQGDRAIRAVAMMPEANGQTELLFPSFLMQVAIAGSDVVTTVTNAGLGGLSSEVFSLEARDNDGAEVTSFVGSRVLVKLPYNGSNTNLEQVKVIFSVDSGSNWSVVSVDDIVTIQPHSDAAGAESEGFVAFWTDHFSDYAVVDSTVSAAPSGGGGTTSASSSGGGGATGYELLLLSLLAGYGLQRRRKLALKS